MPLRFVALDPTFAVVGTAPQYRAQFIDEVTGLAAAPDSVLSIQILTTAGVLERSFIPPDITNPSLGLYEAQDAVALSAGVYEVRWTYVEAAVTKTASTLFEVVTTVLGNGDQMILDYVLHQLGDGVMFVGLPAGTLESSLRQAKLWYAMNLGQNKRVSLTLNPANVPFDVADDCYYVVNVYFEGLKSQVTEALGAFGVWGFTQLGMSNIPVEDLYGQSGSQGFYGSLVQSLQYAEMGRRILSSEPSWEWRERERKLYVLPCPEVSVNAVVDYVSTEVDTSNMMPHEELLLKEYTLAKAKHALGIIRRKYSGFATAQGERSLDGDSLVLEANDMMRELDTKIMMYAPSGWIITG